LVLLCVLLSSTVEYCCQSYRIKHCNITICTSISDRVYDARWYYIDYICVLILGISHGLNIDNYLARERRKIYELEGRLYVFDILLTGNLRCRILLNFF